MKMHAASSSEALPPNRTASHSGRQQCSPSPSPDPPTSHKQNQPIAMTHKALPRPSHVPKTVGLNRWSKLFSPGYKEATLRRDVRTNRQLPYKQTSQTAASNSLCPPLSTSILAVRTDVLGAAVPASPIFI